jgi:hypothetical protein
MHGLNQRVQRLEEQTGVNGKYVSVPLPGQGGQFVRLPRPFAEWMARVGQDDRPVNYTDGERGW